MGVERDNFSDSVAVSCSFQTSGSNGKPFECRVSGGLRREVREIDMRESPTVRHGRQE